MSHHLPLRQLYYFWTSVFYRTAGTLRNNSFTSERLSGDGLANGRISLLGEPIPHGHPRVARDLLQLSGGLPRRSDSGVVFRGQSWGHEKTRFFRDGLAHQRGHVVGSVVQLQRSHPHGVRRRTPTTKLNDDLGFQARRRQHKILGRQRGHPPSVVQAEDGKNFRETKVEVFG